MRRFLSLLVGSLVLLLSGIPVALLLHAADDLALSAHASAPPPGRASAADASPCQPVYNKIADPNVVLLGEAVDITLTVKALCASERIPLHVVLVLDGSGSMQGQKNQQLRQAGSRLIRNLDMDTFPSTKVGVVEFNSQARRLCSLTNNTNQAVTCVNRVGANGGTRIDLGILEGLRVLSQGRGGLRRGELTEVMVVLSDGINNAGCAPVLSAARQARGQGVMVIAVCVGNDCDEQCMRQVASAPRYYFRAENPLQLMAVFERISRHIVHIHLRSLTVADSLPDWLEYVPDSAVPSPSEPKDPDQWLRWDDVFVPTDGVTYAFKARPLETGYMPVSAGAHGKLVDSKGRTRQWEFSVPWVTVLQAEPLATVATPPPTPTFTPVPTDTPAPDPTPTPTPTLTPTPRPKPVYLPIGLKERAGLVRYYADVALVMDTSTSMRWPTTAGRPKHEAALEASLSFVSGLQYTPDETGRHDQVAIVGYNDQAWIEQPLTRDLAAIEQALAGLPARQAEGTRLDLAFERGSEALDPALTLQGNQPVIVLLTDGLPNRVPLAPDGTMRTTVLMAASDAKDRGALVFTIGLGNTDPGAPLLERVDSDLLRECASEPGMFHTELSAEDLSRIYGRIHRTIDPTIGRHDWGEPWPPTVEPPRP